MKITWNSGADLREAIAGGGSRMRYSEVCLPEFPFELTFERYGLPFVRVGQKLLAGDPIDRYHHVPFSGTVASIGEHTVRFTCEGEEAAFTRGYPKSLRDSTAEELLSFLAASGIPGSRPGTLLADEMREIVSVPIGEKGRTVVMNIAGQEPGCEALLCSVLTREGDAVSDGLKILMKLTSARKALFILPEDDIKLLNLAEKVAANSKMFRVVTLKNASYPASDPRRLVSLLTERELPPEMGDSLTILEHTGMFTLTPELCVEVFYAFSSGTPYQFVPVFVGGNAFRKPKLVRLPIGLKIADCFSACADKRAGQDKNLLYVCGKGPMTGRKETEDGFLRPTDRVLLVSTPGGLGLTGLAASCSRCGRCVSACPAFLIPPDIITALETGNDRKILSSGARTCLSCGTCSFVCPAGLPVSEYMEKAKKRSAEGWIKKHPDEAAAAARPKGPAPEEAVPQTGSDRTEEAAAVTASPAEAERESAQGSRKQEPAPRETAVQEPPRKTLKDYLTDFFFEDDPDAEAEPEKEDDDCESGN